MSAPEPDLARFLQEQGLADQGDEGEWSPLSGGVSSDIWRVRTGRGTFCVKRALAQLKVAAEWSAPIERNANEWNFLEEASRIAPGAVPSPLAHDPARNAFAMSWLEAADHRNWKDELLARKIDPAVAGRLGSLLGRIHRATAGSARIARTFATDAAFHALRIEPYLLAAADKHPDLAKHLRSLAEATARTRLTLVHGDVSPKNVMVGPDGPILLDAEVAWYGDPAFDLAFCLNHLAIKARTLAGSEAKLAQCRDRLVESYRAHADWEDWSGLDRRAAALLPALALARVDGKSPLEYLDRPQRDALRHTAHLAILRAPTALDEAWGLLVAAEG